MRTMKTLGGGRAAHRNCPARRRAPGMGSAPVPSPDGTGSGGCRSDQEKCDPGAPPGWR